MNRFARSSIALTAIIALTVTVLSGTPGAGATPTHVLAARSIDISGDRFDCDAAPAPAHANTGLTLTISASSMNLAIASIAQRAGDTDGLTTNTPPMRAGRNIACAARTHDAPARLAV